MPRVQQELLRVFNRLVGTCYVVQHEGRVVHWSEPLTALLGYERSAMLGRRANEVLQPLDVFGNAIGGGDACPVLHHAREGRPMRPFTLSLRAREGRYVQLTCAVTLLGGGSKDVHAIQQLFPIEARHPTPMGASPLPIPRARTPEPIDPEAALLTPREREVLSLLASGLASNEIASRLGIAEITVRNHTQNAIRRLGVHTKVEAVVQAYRLGLVIPGSG